MVVALILYLRNNLFVKWCTQNFKSGLAFWFTVSAGDEEYNFGLRNKATCGKIIFMKHRQVETCLSNMCKQ